MPRATHRILLVAALFAALVGALAISGEGGSTSGRSGGASSTAPQDSYLSAAGNAQLSSPAPEMRPAPSITSRALPVGPTSGVRPTITSVAPRSGSVAGGNEVTIYGENLFSAQILFDSAPAKIVSQTPEAVTVIVPRQDRPRAVTIVVTNRDGQYAVKSSAYSYGG